MPTKYAVDENFFARIDTEAKAYVLGYLAGDGSLSVPKLTLRVTTHPRDRTILERIRDAMGSTHPIEVREQDSTFGHQTIARLSISRKHLVEDIQRLGFAPLKKDRSVFPFVRQSLRRHLARGLFDADGCIHADRRGTVHVIMSSSERLLSGYSRWVRDVVDVPATVRQAHFCHEVRVARRDEIPFRLLDEMYEGATIFLDRKRATWATLRSNYAERDARTKASA